MPGVRANKTHPYALDQGMFTALNVGLFSSKNETGGRQGWWQFQPFNLCIVHEQEIKPFEQYTSQYTVQPSKSLIFRVKALQVGDKQAQYFYLYTPNHVHVRIHPFSRTCIHFQLRSIRFAIQITPQTSIPFTRISHRCHPTNLSVCYLVSLRGVNLSVCYIVSLRGVQMDNYHRVTALKT